jgi:hypothetical protein
MKKGMILAVVMLVMSTLALPALAGKDETGNGAPSGNHFTLNIIGVDNPKNVNMNQGAGNTIFVKLGSDTEGLDQHTKISLIEGETFAVLDKNGTDADGAKFQLPAPGTDAYIIGSPGDADTTTDYSVFVRPLGKPGGWCTITTCADVLDSTFGGLLPNNVQRTIQNSAGYFGGYASLEQVGYEITHRDAGQEKFTNVTAQLTTIVFKVWVDLDAGGDVDANEIFYVRVPIFDDSLQGEYWDYDNNGLKVLQVRFYPGVPSDLTDWDSPYLPK